LKALFAAMSRSEHPKGSTIIHAGAEADNVLYIESGRVLISRALSNGRRQRLRAMLAGALVGEIAFNLGGKRTADVVAEEDTVVLSLSADQIRQWERESPELTIAFYRFMARQLADKVVTANRIAEHAAH
jgi:SulP family sulfate permease